MFAYDKGIPFRSRPIPFATGSTQNVDLSFLYSPNQRMRAPVVRELVFEFSGSVSGTTGGLATADMSQIFNKIEIRDRGGVIHDLPGKLIRERQIIELGARGGNDIDAVGTIASGATVATARFFVRIPFDLEQARNGADTALPLLHLVNGGEIFLTFGTPTNGVVSSGNITTYAIVHDEKERELKSRMVVRNFAVTVSEDDYILNGSTRLLALLSNPTTGLSDYPVATFPTIDVPELEYSQLSTQLLRSEYLRVRMDRFADDPFTLANTDGIPLIWPSKGQRIDKLPDLRSVRIRLPAAAPTAAQLLYCYIEDRYPALAAEWMGSGDLQSFVQAMNARGKVKLAGGGLADPATMSPTLARRLPMVLT